MQMAKVPVVLGFLAIVFMMQLASQSIQSIWAYYKTLAFGWNE